MPEEYLPDRGDAIWIDMDPSSGHEQSGRRPAVVLSRSIYNRSSGLMIVCPVTSRVKGYPYEVELPSGIRIHGVALSDQIKSFDYKARNAEFICILPDDTVQTILGKSRSLLQPAILESTPPTSP